MVAEELIELHEIDTALLQPVCEALVELGSHRLRQRVVGGVADQQVAETEAVFTCELRLGWPDQPFAYQGGEAWSHLGLVRRHRLDRAAMKDLPFDRTALEHAPLASLQLVEACSQQRLQRGRNDNFARLLSRHRHHLFDEERIATGRPSDLRAQLARQVLGNQLLDLLSAKGFESKSHGPGGAAVE